MRIIITGGSGFIGSQLIKLITQSGNHEIFNIDKQSYASNESFNEGKYKNYHLVNIDLFDEDNVLEAVRSINAEIVYHLAAETHVDNSILSPKGFIQSNIIGTFNLIEALRKLNVHSESKLKKFIHISTDEVYGDNKNYVTEDHKYSPSSPYSASKASSDLLVMASHRTFSLPAIMTHCSNNFGPNQNKEKFIPKIINSFLNQEIIPVYGNGKQTRDWLFVEDHVKALKLIQEKGQIGSRYNISTMKNYTNLDIINIVEKVLINIEPNKIKIPAKNDLINFVTDRPGHDINYKLDSTKLRKELKWLPESSLEENLKSTIRWYIEDNQIKVQ